MAVQRAISTALAAVFLSAAMVIVVAQAATTGDGTKKGNAEPTTDLVVEACTNMSSIKRAHFDDDVCVSVLRSDNRSAVARDHGDLVMVALDLLDRRCNEVAAKIDGMLRSLPVHNETERAFQLCAADFASMVRTVPVCRDTFLELKPLGKKVKELDAMEALGCMDRIGVAATDCAWWLATKWDYAKAEEYYDVVSHVSLPWGLMELATGYTNDNSQW